MLLAFAIGALGNLLGRRDHRHLPGLGRDASPNACTSCSGSVLSLLIGFMLGVLIRASTGAIVAYFVYSFLLPTIFGLLADQPAVVPDLQPWVDVQFAQSGLFIFDGALTGEQWANIAVTGVIWLVIPLAVGLGFVMRAEVK